MPSRRIHLRSLRRIEQAYIFIALTILCFSGIMKLAAVAGTVRLLASEHPLFGVPWRYVMLGAGALELALAAYLVFGELAVKIATCASFAILIIVYRTILWISNISLPCGCLGNPHEWWPWLAANEAKISNGMLAVFVGGSAICFSLRFWSVVGPHAKRLEALSIQTRQFSPEE